MKGIIDYILARGKEKSTWATVLTLVLGATGLHLAPELQEQIITAGIAILTAIGILTAEKPAA